MSSRNLCQRGRHEAVREIVGAMACLPPEELGALCLGASRALTHVKDAGASWYLEDPEGLACLVGVMYEEARASWQRRVSTAMRPRSEAGKPAGMKKTQPPREPAEKCVALRVDGVLREALAALGEEDKKI